MRAKNNNDERTTTMTMAVAMAMAKNIYDISVVYAMRGRRVPP